MENHSKIEEEKATKLKNQANELFKEEKFLESLKMYEKSLKKWQKFLEKSGHDFENTDNHLLSVLHSNIGLCHKNLYTSGDVSHYEDDGTNITRVSRLNAALESYSKAISADPLWEKPHLRKSVIFQMIKDVYIQDEGVLDKLDAVKDREEANIIVDMTQDCPRKKVKNQIIFNDFQRALDACKDGDKMFLEVGVYEFVTSVRIDKQITVVGASTGTILRCVSSQGGASVDGTGFRTEEEARANPLAAFTIVAYKSPVLLKRLRFQMMLYIKCGFTIEVVQCLFDGENHFTIIQVDPMPSGSKDKNVKIPKEMRKFYNWDGSDKKKTIETFPIMLTLKHCMFVKCFRKNPLMINGEAVHMTLVHCLFEDCSDVVVRHGAVVGFKDCEIKVHGKLKEQNWRAVMTMCSNKSRLHLVQTNMLAGIRVSGASFAYKTQGEISKCYFQYSEANTTPNTATHVMIAEAIVIVKRSLFVNKSRVAPKDDQHGILMLRQYSSGSKILQNKFVDCSMGIHLNNGASPNVHANIFQGKTKNHVVLAGGANPNIVENVFDLTEKNEGGPTLGVNYKGGAGGILARNTFIKGATSVCIDNTSTPVLLGNIFKDAITNVSKIGSTTYVTIHQYEGNSFVNNAEEEKEMAERLKVIRENPTEALRLCGACGEYKPCEICGTCKSKYYCSPECQREDWPKHEQNCSETGRLRKGGKDIVSGGKRMEPCQAECPYWTKNQCQYCHVRATKGGNPTFTIIA